MSSSGGGGGSSSASTQLEFHTAMNDFRVMFPGVDADVIEAVLRANNGAVDATIDHLLVMSADNESEGPIQPGRYRSAGGLDHPPAYPPLQPPSYQQATMDGGHGLEADLINLGQDSGGSGLDDAGGGFDSLDSGNKKRDDIKEPLDLLSDLDLMGAAGGAGCSASSSSSPPTSAPVTSSHQKAGHSYSHSGRQDNTPPTTEPLGIVPTQQMLQDRYEENLRRREEARHDPESAAMAQYLEDERLALMMQNEEFMAELRRDREFMSALEEDTDPAYDPSLSAAMGASSLSRSQSVKAKSGGVHMDEAVFKEKLKNMGKTSRRKFAQLASMFSRRRGAAMSAMPSAKQLLGHAPAPSKDNLLLNDEPLVAADDDDEDDDDDREERGKRKQKTPTKGKYTSFS